jgi:hypothetical protein
MAIGNLLALALSLTFAIGTSDIVSSRKTSGETEEAELNQESSSSEEVLLSVRSFRVPVRIDSDRKDEIEKVVIYLSRNKGQTWRKCTEVLADRDGFNYFAATDGLYWFACCVIDKEGNRHPARTRQLRAQLRVKVDTSK